MIHVACLLGCELERSLQLKDHRPNAPIWYHYASVLRDFGVVANTASTRAVLRLHYRAANPDSVFQGIHHGPGTGLAVKAPPLASSEEVRVALEATHGTIRALEGGIAGGEAMRGLIAGLLALAVAPAGAVSSDEAVNHCHTKETNQKWAKLAAENHGSDAIQRLYALRLGLCVQVERGVLTVPRATTIFERQRDEVIQRIRNQEGKGPKGT